MRVVVRDPSDLYRTSRKDGRVPRRPFEVPLLVRRLRGVGECALEIRNRKVVVREPATHPVEGIIRKSRVSKDGWKARRPAITIDASKRAVSNEVEDNILRGSRQSRCRRRSRWQGLRPGVLRNSWVTGADENC